jgi:hypothetical protein
MDKPSGITAKHPGTLPAATPPLDNPGQRE